MEGGYRYVLALLALFALRVRADCTSYGVDYSNGGTYNIDGTSNQYFSFVTVFQGNTFIPWHKDRADNELGCTQETIQPVLVGPDGSEYACSAIRTQPSGSQVTSTCGIPFSVMKSGSWKIIVSGDQIATQRNVNLIVGAPQTVWITATPTVVVGITSTARATTVVNTIAQTQTLILVPQTITAACNGGTRTVTVYPQGPTVTVASTVMRTATDGQVTSYLISTVSATAVCHYPTSGSSSTSYDNNPARPTSCSGSNCQPWQGKGKGGGGGGWGRTRGPGSSNPTIADKKRDVAATAAVAAVTSTVTQTTLTITSTVRTTIPARTVTEQVLRTVTATITPAPSTVCGSGGAAGTTVTVNRGTPTTTTQTNVVYQTTHLSGTLWIGYVPRLALLPTAVL
ncbi:hypothetical protein B0H66DRAFT_604940 [Apodospora peruviana]|uniref:Uncharacterized protein n=1 Tax=Apodospora peruviana TaxID=516989 RepID=A0AAE0I1Z5_9PEZI|nr:hypothetical protein B0H66DRAFT_604940 [Apodospora peruviana]